MKFQIKDLKKILHSIQNNNIDQIKITSQRFELIINKTTRLVHKNNTKKSFYTNKILNTNKHISHSLSKHLSTNSNQTNESETYFTVVSPMVGTFYRSPAPNEPAFVELYEIVKKKQTVCIIEAMKLMNEIEAEVQGEIAEILVKDGDIVDCGQALIKVKAL